MCVYIYIHTYIHTCMHTYIRTYVRTYINTDIYIHIHTHTYTYIQIYTHRYTYRHVRLTNTYIHRHTYIRTYIPHPSIFLLHVHILQLWSVFPIPNTTLSKHLIYLKCLRLSFYILTAGRTLYLIMKSNHTGNDSRWWQSLSLYGNDRENRIRQNLPSGNLAQQSNLAMSDRYINDLWMMDVSVAIATIPRQCMRN